MKFVTSSIFILNLLYFGEGAGYFRLRRQIGLGALWEPVDGPRGIRQVLSETLPNTNILNFDLTDDDLDYFDIGPEVFDKFGRPKENKCKVGRQQSPIDIDTRSTVWTEYPPLSMNSHWSFKHKVLIFNEGHTLMLKEKGGTNRPKLSGGPLRGESYTFEQLHFHWGPDPSTGSEHTINGQSYSAEAHMVHYLSRYGSFKNAKEKKGLVVLGYLFKVSPSDNPALDDFMDTIPLISKFRNVTFSTPDILKLFKHASSACYFKYTGSLTTGDCAEGVLWIVFNQTIPVSASQLNQFRNLYGSDRTLLKSNYRSVQKLNHRTVEFVSKSPQGTKDSNSQREPDLVIWNS